MIDTADFDKIANRAWQLIRQLDPTKPAVCPHEYFEKLRGWIHDIERTVRSGQPGADVAEACLAQAIREYDKAPPPSPDQLLAEVLKKERAGAK